MPNEKKKLASLQSEGDLNISPKRTAWTKKNIDPQTQNHLEEDATYFLHQSLSTPCLNILKKCEGIYIEDIQGKRLMDFHGNNVHQVGFGNKYVIEAIKRQLDTLSFCTRRYSNIPAIELAKKLISLTPGDLNRVLFAPAGTLATGMALKLARLATGRYKTISMWDSFHGASLDAISVGGERIFRQDIGPLLPGNHHVPPPDSYHCMWDCSGQCNLKCADYIEYIMEKEGDVAAVIAETIRCTPVIPSLDYWKRVRQICDKNGALLILDEIPLCLGRSGKMFAFEHYSIIPDIVIIGKGLGGGVLPFAALIARESLNIAQDSAIGHYTHEKNPVAAAAALATIQYIEEYNLLRNTQEVGSYALSRLIQMKNTYPLIGDVRGIGLLLGIELVRNRETKEAAKEEAEIIMYDALTKGLNFKTTMGNIITLTPPLTITKEEMEQALSIIESCLNDLA
jgi:4-aminobutyrate aminotransferase